MSDPSAETRALLLTDLVGSTALAERLGDARMAVLSAAHDRVARDLLARHRGREVERTDGFLLLFDDVAAAVSYAIAYHAALKDLGLQARAGVHAGPVTLRTNSASDVARCARPVEVEGPVKSVAVRTMSLAAAGQTLMTATAAASWSASADAAVVLSRHGFWRFRGIVEPDELFEPGAPGASPLVPPPDTDRAWRVARRGDVWVPVRAVPTSLPRERDAFFGREADLVALWRLLEGGAPLVSVLGIGGTGKTRLATRHGWTWLGAWPGGVWFCDLSEARDAEGICFAVARALDVPLRDGDPVDQLGHAIAGRGTTLVILDNFEQVTRCAQETLGRWLDRAPHAKWVVTTREVLGLPGEVALQLAPLPIDAAVALFAARAAAARRGFALPDADRPVVAELVRVLDGLPLAIELAAARVRTMSPRAILDAMSDRFRLLSSTGVREGRRATLRGVLDWSWDLLTDDERMALAQMSVFEGGCTLESAEAVLALGAMASVDAVQSLVDKSLVRLGTDDRLELLVSVHEYAEGRLAESGALVPAQERHGRAFETWGTPAAMAAQHTRSVRTHRALVVREIDNLVAACRRAVARADPRTARLTALGAWSVLQYSGPYELGASLLEAALSVPGALEVEPSILHRNTGWARQLSGQTEVADAHLERAIAAAREAGDRTSEGSALGLRGLLMAERGRLAEARDLGEQALRLSREAGSRTSEASALVNLGYLDAHEGRIESARARYGEAIAIARDAGNLVSLALAHLNLGNLQIDAGETASARASYEAALALTLECGDRRGEAILRANLGFLHAEQGRVPEAREHFAAALDLSRTMGDRRAAGFAWGRLGLLDADAGVHAAARENLTRALALHREVSFRAGQPHHLAGLARIEDAAGSPAWEAFADEAVAVAAGCPLVLAEVLSVRATLRCAHGRIADARGDVDAARALGPTGTTSGLVAVADARVRVAEGRPAEAAAALRTAADIALAGGAGAESPLARRIAEVQALLPPGT